MTLFLSSNIMKHALRTVLFSIREITFSKLGVQLAVTTAVIVDTLQVLLNLTGEHNFMRLSVALVKNLLKKFETLQAVAVVVVKEALRTPQPIIQVQVEEVLLQFTTKAIQLIIES